MRAILVGIHNSSKSYKEASQSLKEMEGLVYALNGTTIGKLYQKRESPEPATYIGKGKAKQLQELVEGTKADTVIFDVPLSPVQISNLEEITGAKVIDRTDLILQIFSERARTKQAKLQVELAKLEHELPRIYGQEGKYMSRIGGGYKTKGAGEKFGEVRVRTIKKRISTIKKQLKEIKKQRKEQRKGRQKDFNLLNVALVGYTNVGKSSLLKRITKRDTFVSNQLFATLDTKTSFIKFPDINKKVLLTDTVGFVKDMPKEIMDAFMATLEEVSEADLILHVVDVSDGSWMKKVEIVDEILNKVGAKDKPQILVLNKIDKVIPSKEFLDYTDESIAITDRKSVIVSTKEGWNIDKLLEMLKEEALKKSKHITLGGKKDV